MNLNIKTNTQTWTNLRWPEKIQHFRALIKENLFASDEMIQSLI